MNNIYQHNFTTIKPDSIFTSTIIDPKMVDRLVKIFNKSKVDYLTNTKDPNFNKDFFFYPDGLDIEIFSFSSLKKIKNYSLTEFHKQHVSSFLRYSDKFKKLYIKQKKVYKNLKLSVDDEKSLKNIKKIFNFFYPNIYFSYNDIIKKKLFEKFCNQKQKTFQKVLSYGELQNKLFLVEICYYQKILIDIYQITGPHIINLQKAAPLLI